MAVRRRKRGVAGVKRKLAAAAKRKHKLAAAAERTRKLATRAAAASLPKRNWNLLPRKAGAITLPTRTGEPWASSARAGETAQARKGKMVKRPAVRDMDWISVGDMAEALACHPETVLRYIHAGVIQASRGPETGIRGRWRIPRDFAIAFIEERGGRVRRGRPPAPPEQEQVDPRQLKLCE